MKPRRTRIRSCHETNTYVLSTVLVQGPEWDKRVLTHPSSVDLDWGLQSHSIY